MLIVTSNMLAYSSSYSNSFMILPLIMLFIYAVMFCVWLVVSYWGYKDAKKRGQNGLLWGIVIFFGGLVGILVYLAIRNNLKTETPRRMCPNCGRVIPFDANICPYCAKKFETYY